MQITTVVCDGCGQHPEEDQHMIMSGVDLCMDCYEHAVELYLSSRKRPLQSECKACDGIGSLQAIDEAATDAQATCGENRTQYKTVECDNCKF